MGIEMLAGLGLSLAGTGLGVAASMQDKNAMNAKVGDELMRQQGYQKQATNVFQSSTEQSGADTAQKQIGEGQDKQQSLYNTLQATPIKTSSASSDPVTDARTQAFIGQQNQAGSKLAGYGNWNTQQALKDMAANRQLGVIGGLSQQSQQVLPYEVQQASHSGDGLAFAGQGLSALGSLAGLYGIYNSLPSASSGLGPTGAQLGAMRQGYGPLSASAAQRINPFLY